jgi:hypothetical protein
MSKEARPTGRGATRTARSGLQAAARRVWSAAAVPFSRFSFVRSLVIALSLALVGAVVVGSYACGTGDTTGITPITGIVIRADDLVAGHGCGTGPDEVYMYSVVVSTFGEGGATPAFIAGGTYPCYADATFVNLCASTSGALSFDVQVYAFSEAQYAVAGATPGLLSTSPSYCSLDGGHAIPEDLDPCTAKNALQTTASFTAGCTATQQSSIEVVAVCSALVPASRSVTCGEDSGT